MIGNSHPNQQREGSKEPVKLPVRPINPTDLKPTIASKPTPVPKRFDSQSYANSRSQRETTVFNNYTVNQPRYQQYNDRYNDGMNTFFWLWLLDHPHYQAQYLYNYENSLDKERIAELKSKNSALELELRKLEENKTPKDLKNSKFADVDPDLMWSLLKKLPLPKQFNQKKI